MLNLNLVNQSKSDIKYKISQFPDGQQTIDILTPALGTYLQGKDVRITARISTFRDLEVIIAANQALREMSVSTVMLYVPYFLGARSDRKFQKGGVNYLKHVICPIINSQNFDGVLVLDPHSNVLEGCLNNFEKIDNFNLVKYALMDIDNQPGFQERTVLVSPDGGAFTKIYSVAKEFQIPNIVNAIKHRDIKTGDITHTEVLLSSPETYENKKFVIVDDICDGGRTFIELAKAIQNKIPDAKMYLVVTHGIFSNGFEQLNNWFEKIYTTNSVKELENTEQLLTFNVML